MRVYKSAGDSWILWTDTEKLFYNSELEAKQAMANIQAAKAILTAVQSLAMTFDDTDALIKEHFDVGNNTMSADELAAVGVPDQATLDACVTLLQQIDSLAGGEATAPADYRATLNKVRRL